MHKYFLKHFGGHKASNHDRDVKPAYRRANAGMRARRSIDELLGVCKGCIADGAINADEAIFIGKWLEENRNIAVEWPANILLPCIESMLADGTFNESELAKLFSILTELTGNPTVPGHELTTPTHLPIDRELKPVVFAGHSFCLTGKFAYGSREECERAIIGQGGLVKKNVSKQVDYLVIGAACSPDWAHSPFGRKIEAAVEFQKQGARIAIVPEDHWAVYLV